MKNKTIKISIMVQTWCPWPIAHDTEKCIATSLMKLNDTSYNRHEFAQPT